MSNPRILYCAWTAPNGRSGATLAMRRHFIEHDDFTVMVITSDDIEQPGIRALQLKPPPWLARIGRTRFARLVRNLEMLFIAPWLSKEVLRAAKKFKPDAVFTVADLTLSEVARKIARKLGIPLITNFQDWWPRGQFYYASERPYKCLVPYFERRFRRLHRDSALVFCTSEGMRDYLGQHPNSHVLYPIGARRDQMMSTRVQLTRKKKRLLYAGTAFGSYGQMLRELSASLVGIEGWELLIFGTKPDWPSDDIARAERDGIYRGFLSFERLREEFLNADACLVIMSFDKTLEIMMRTSFTTKLLDYCAFARPIVVWGPPHCPPVRLIKRHNAGLVVESRDPASVVACLERLRNDPSLGETLTAGASSLAATVLSHEAIHAVFVSRIQSLIAK